MSNSNNLLPLEPDKYYHIFNNVNGKVKFVCER